MVLLTEELRKKIPTLYSQQHVKDPWVICKFSDPVGSWTWYVIEGSFVDTEGNPTTGDNAVDYLFFGFVAGHTAELGYFTETELETAKDGLRGLRAAPIERDLYFTPCRLSEVKKLHSVSNGY